MLHINKNLLILLIIIVSASIMYLISGFPQINKTACTLEAKICSDGSSVGRTGPNCEFAPCPTVAPTAVQENGQEKTCGGIAGKICPEGYVCNMRGKNYPDASGTCIKVGKTVKEYECPKTEYIDCLPGNFMMKDGCSASYLQWAKKNCPGFKGAAY